MSGIQQHTGLVVHLYAANVDTDAIIPKQFCKSESHWLWQTSVPRQAILDDAGEKPTQNL